MAVVFFVGDPGGVSVWVGAFGVFDGLIVEVFDALMVAVETVGEKEVVAEAAGAGGGDAWWVRP